MLLPTIPPDGPKETLPLREDGLLPPYDVGEFRDIVIPPTEALVNIAPTAKLVKSMTFMMHLSIGGVEVITEGTSDCTGSVAGDVVGVRVASGVALGLDVVGKLFGLAVGLALGEVVGSAVSPQSLNDILPMVICCVK